MPGLHDSSWCCHSLTASVRCQFANTQTIPDIFVQHKNGHHTQAQQSMPQTQKKDKAATFELTQLPEHAQLLSSNTCSIFASCNAKPTHLKCLQVLCNERTHSHIHTHTHTQRNKHTYTCTYSYTHTHEHTHAHPHTCTHSHTHTHTHAHTHTRTPTQMHTHTRTRKPMHTHTRTHTHRSCRRRTNSTTSTSRATTPF